MKFQRKAPFFDTTDFRKFTKISALTSAALLSISPMVEKTAEAQQISHPDS
jgi:hypothetical protein